MEKLTIIKVGGNIIDNQKQYEKFIPAFAKIEGKKILVHGGGKIASKFSEQIGIKPNMIDGRRVTTKETLDVVTMVYAGLVNKNLVAKLQKHSCNALGLCGADANIIRAEIRSKSPIDFGFVGDLNSNSINTEVLINFLNSGLVPIFSAINHNGEGQLLNTNADTIASSIAIALSSHYKVSLTMVFDKPGVLENLDDITSTIKEIDKNRYKELISKNIIHSGMIPKIDNAFFAIDNGVESITLTNPEFITKESKYCTVIK